MQCELALINTSRKKKKTTLYSDRGTPEWVKKKKGINYKGDERKLLDVLDSDAISVDYISFKHASVINSNKSFLFSLLLNGCWWSGKNWNSWLIRGFKLHTAFQAPWAEDTKMDETWLQCSRGIRIRGLYCCGLGRISTLADVHTESYGNIERVIASPLGALTITISPKEEIT